MSRSQRRSTAPRPLAQRSGEIERDLAIIEQAFDTGESDETTAALDRLASREKGVPAAILARLIGGRSTQPALLIDFLTLFAGERAPTFLRSAANDVAAPDLARFSAQLRLGWEPATEAKRRKSFLGTFHDPIVMLTDAADEGTRIWPPNGDSLQEVVGFFAVMPGKQVQQSLHEIVQRLGPRAIILLHAALHLPDPAVQRLAIQQLVGLRDAGAPPALDRLVRTTRDPSLREVARSAAAELRGLPRRQLSPPEPVELPELEECYLSPFDGVGAQVVFVSRAMADEACMFAHFLIRDDHGVKEVGAGGLASRDERDEAIDIFVEDGVPMIEIDLTTARQAIHQGIAFNAATGKPIPPAYEIWDLFLHDSYPPADAPEAPAELDDTPFLGKKLPRNARTFFDHAYLEQFLLPAEPILDAMEAVPPPDDPNRWDEPHYRGLIERVMTPEVIAELRGRLRRQAWVLDVAGEDVTRDRALTFAASLANDDQNALTRNPFVRELIRRSAYTALAELEPLPR